MLFPLLCGAKIAHNFQYTVTYLLPDPNDNPERFQKWKRHANNAIFIHISNYKQIKTQRSKHEARGATENGTG